MDPECMPLDVAPCSGRSTPAESAPDIHCDTKNWYVVGKLSTPLPGIGGLARS